MMAFEKTLIHQRKNSIALIETLIISAINFLACYFFHPTDLLFIHGPFPWMLLAPVLIALLYGLPFALLSYFLLLISAISLTIGTIDFSWHMRLYLFGSVMLVVICGQFGSYWKSRLSHIESLNQYLHEHIDHVARAYYLIKISHDNIEQQFISKPVSLRNTFLSIRDMLTINAGKMSAEIMQRLLEVVSQYCQIEKAQLFLIENKKLLSEPIATVGGNQALVQNDSLIKLTLENKIVNFVSIDEFAQDSKSAYLVVAPIVSSEGDLLGLITVEDMAFRALNHESLEKCMVLLSYFANEQIAAHFSKIVLENFPNCPQDFAFELIQLANLKKDYGADSIMVAIDIPNNTKTAFYLENCQNQKRSLDKIWIVTEKSYTTFITLMPLSKTQAALEYIARIKKYFMTTYDIQLEQESIYFYYHLISSDSAIDNIRLFLKAMR